MKKDPLAAVQKNQLLPTVLQAGKGCPVLKLVYTPRSKIPSMAKRAKKGKCALSYSRSDGTRLSPSDAVHRLRHHSDRLFTDCDQDALLLWIEPDEYRDYYGSPGNAGSFYGSFHEGNEPSFASADHIIPVVTQDVETGAVLMQAWMNQEAWEKTHKGPLAWYCSRKRGLWRKGESSGFSQEVRKIKVDQTDNAILLSVMQVGAACHDGYRSCFYREVMPDGSLKVIEERLFDPKEVYKK